MRGGNSLRVGEMWEKLDEERSLYSNLSGTMENAVVIDEMTGRRVGYLDSKLPAGSKFLMGGHARRVTLINGRKVLTRAETNAENVRQPNQKWNRRVKSAALTKALANELGFPIADETGAMPLVSVQSEKDAEKRVLLFHNAGEVYGKALGELLETERNLAIVEHNEFYVEIAGAFPEINWQFTDEEINRLLNRRWKSFETTFDLGHFQTDLPTDARRASVIAAFNLSKFGIIFLISDEIKLRNLS